MKRSYLAIIIIVLLAIGGTIAITRKNNTPAPASTSSTPSSSQNSTSNQTSSNAVDIKNMMFTPSQITIDKGTTVTWTNDDSVAHTVTDDLSNVGGPSSGDIQPGSTYNFTFNKTGSFQYHCSIHSSMRGTVVVR